MTDPQLLLDRIEIQAKRIAALEQELRDYKLRQPKGWYYKAKHDGLWDYTTKKGAVTKLRREFGPDITIRPDYAR